MGVVASMVPTSEFATGARFCGAFPSKVTSASIYKSRHQWRIQFETKMGFAKIANAQVNQFSAVCRAC
jgi:hypothetical protein